MGKFKMPTTQDFLKKKYIHNPPREPVWVYLEREMRLNAERKPYNTRVANWLLFLKALRYHYYREANSKYNRLCQDCGPVWYIEFSKEQRTTLQGLRSNIHEDLIEVVTTRVKISLRTLGVTQRFPSAMLMSTMLESHEDPGLFLWHLYTKFYKMPPSEERRYYDYNSMLMLSAIVFIDLKECEERLSQFVCYTIPSSTNITKKKSFYYEPKTKFGEYLQKMYVPVYSNHPDELPQPKKPVPITNSITLRSERSLERLAMSTDCIELRKLRNMKEATNHRICEYKFWEPRPDAFHNCDPEVLIYNLKLKMLKMKPNKSYLKLKPQYNIAQFLISSVCYSSGKPVFMMGNIVILPSGHVAINGGMVKSYKGYVTHVCGMWNYIRDTGDKCDKKCDCLATRENAVINHLDETKCQCSHNLDFKCDDTNKKMQPKAFFLPPKNNLPFLFDLAKIYHQDQHTEFASAALDDAIFSDPASTPAASHPKISMKGLSMEHILKIFLAELAETPLLLPHLPQAYRLSNLQESLRRKIEGTPSPSRHKQLWLKAERRWADLSHIDFRARAYVIPFTQKELEHFNWSHRYDIQKLSTILLRNFEARTRANQLQQSRLWWPTMAYDVYPNKGFLDVFFAYMPVKHDDIKVLNPYNPSMKLR